MEKEQFSKLVTGIEPLNESTVRDLKLLVEENPSFQIGWLLYLKNLKQINSPDFNAILKRVAVHVSNRKLLYMFLNPEIKKPSIEIDLEKTISGSYRLTGDTEVAGGDSLIDKFLSASPERGIRQSQKEKEEFSNEYVKQVVAKSIDENDEIITETLALIYFKQKNYGKAQEAYKKLSLKYPEKSVYFATRIKEIEKLKNI